MNKVAISLALVAVCVGAVAAFKFDHRQRHQTHDESDYILEPTHSGHNPRHRFEGGSCEEQCSYHYGYKPRHNHNHNHNHNHDHNNNHNANHNANHNHNHGHRNGHKHRNDRTDGLQYIIGSSGEKIYFYNDRSSPSPTNNHDGSVEGQHFFNDHFDKSGSNNNNNNGGGSGDTGVHVDDFGSTSGGSSDDSSDMMPHQHQHHHHGLRKHKVKPTRQGKRIGSRKGDNNFGGFKTRKEEFHASGPEGSTKLSDRKSIEAHKEFLAGDRTSFDAGVIHSNNEDKESFRQRQTLNNDKTFFRDRSTGVNNIDAFRSSIEHADSGHISAENAKFIGASAGASASDDKEFDNSFSSGRIVGLRTSEDS